MRYVIKCHRCTGPEVICAELDDDQRCPTCQSVPGTYRIGEEDYCWLHREKMTLTYPVFPHFLFTAYAWRGEEWQFPNAKLFEAAGEEGSFTMSVFCEQCQRLYEQWLNRWRGQQKAPASE